MSKTVLFFGNERLATGVTTTAPTLQALIGAGYNVAAVISSYERGRSRNSRDLEIAAVAAEYNIPLLLPDKLLSIADDLGSYGAMIGVLVAYGKIVPQRIIDIFPNGIVNIHPSLLPLHRGPTPIESSIIAGETRTGVSLMKLVQAMDAGPVYAQQTVPLGGSESKQFLSDLLLQAGKDMLLDSLSDILDGSLAPQPQDDSLASYDQRISKQDGIIDWKKPATMLEREIRAYLDWPKSRTVLAGKEVIITSSSVLELSGTPGEVKTAEHQLVVCAGEKALRINTLKPAGKNEMTGEAFLAGHRDLFR